MQLLDDKGEEILDQKFSDFKEFWWNFDNNKYSWYA